MLHVNISENFDDVCREEINMCSKVILEFFHEFINIMRFSMLSSNKIIDQHTKVVII